MSFLVFRLYGPMASWGQVAVGEDRPSGLYPTRSAVLGILAAALGLERSNNQIIEINNGIQIAVKQLFPTTILRDYHTTQVPSSRRGVVHSSRKSELSEDKLNTILSNRDYRCDGVWVIAIRVVKEMDYTLEQFEQALLKPVFSLYLGRKSCPLSVPLSPRIVTTANLKEALDSPFPNLTRSAKEDGFWLRDNNWVTYYWEGNKDEIEGEVVITTKPWDNPLSKTRWQFSQRTVHQLSIWESF